MTDKTDSRPLYKSFVVQSPLLSQDRIICQTNHELHGETEDHPGHGLLHARQLPQPQDPHPAEEGGDDRDPIQWICSSAQDSLNKVLENVP